MYSEHDKCSKSRSMLVFITGAVIITMGGLGIQSSWQAFSYVLSEYDAGNSPYNSASLIYQGLWLSVAICTAITGLSLIVSALRRKAYDLIPGPTLYILGLCLVVIACFLLMGGVNWKAITILVVGLFLIYWEWGYHVS